MPATTSKPDDTTGRFAEMEQRLDEARNSHAYADQRSQDDTTEGARIVGVDLSTGADFSAKVEGYVGEDGVAHINRVTYGPSATPTEPTTTKPDAPDESTTPKGQRA